MNIIIKTLYGDDHDTINISEKIFGLLPRKDILHRIICWQLAKRRQGTHQSKSRANISRTGAKMYKQKGTGRARHSSSRAPQFRGGGKSHGPVSRSHYYSLPKKIRSLGILHALSSKMKENNIVIIDELKIDKPKTKILSKMLKKIDIFNALFIDVEEIDKNFKLSLSNIPNINLISVKGINVYDILRHNKLVLSNKALNSIEERFAL